MGGKERLTKQELQLAEMIIEENSETIQDRWKTFFVNNY